MACDGFVAIKVLELVMSAICLIYKRVSDDEARRLELRRERVSQEWPLFTIVTIGSDASVATNVAYGAYILVCTGLLLGQVTGELDYGKRRMETFFLLIGVVVFGVMGSMIYTVLDSVDPELVDNTAILGTLSLVTALLFLLDALLGGRKKRKLKPSTSTAPPPIRLQTPREDKVTQTSDNYARVYLGGPLKSSFKSPRKSVPEHRRVTFPESRENSPPESDLDEIGRGESPPERDAMPSVSFLPGRTSMLPMVELPGIRTKDKTFPNDIISTYPGDSEESLADRDREQLAPLSPREREQAFLDSIRGGHESTRPEVHRDRSHAMLESMRGRQESAPSDPHRTFLGRQEITRPEVHSEKDRDLQEVVTSKNSRVSGSAKGEKSSRRAEDDYQELVLLSPREKQLLESLREKQAQAQLSSAGLVLDAHRDRELLEVLAPLSPQERERLLLDSLRGQGPGSERRIDPGRGQREAARAGPREGAASPHWRFDSREANRTPPHGSRDSPSSPLDPGYVLHTAHNWPDNTPRTPSQSPSEGDSPPPPPPPPLEQDDVPQGGSLTTQLLQRWLKQRHTKVTKARSNP